MGTVLPQSCAMVTAVLPKGPGQPGDVVPATVARPPRPMREIVVEVQAVAMTTYPRVPGDFAGASIEGPSELVGLRVWGTGSGGCGFTWHGSHAAEQAVLLAAGVIRGPNQFTAEPGDLRLVSGAAVLPLADAAEGSALVNRGSGVQRVMLSSGLC